MSDLVNGFTGAACGGDRSLVGGASGHSKKKSHAEGERRGHLRYDTIAVQIKISFYCEISIGRRRRWHTFSSGRFGLSYGSFGLG